MRRPLAIPQRPISIPHGNCETLWLQCHKRQARAPIAPIAWQARLGRRRTVVPSMPPRAATGSRAERASRAQRTGPRATASGWLRVAKAGERKASEAPARRARNRSASPWAELVVKPRRRWTPGQWPARRCIPAPSAAASLASPATTRARRRARQIFARSCPSLARPGSPSWRSTTPASPRGRRATAGRGSGRRRASVNSHRTGRSAPRRRRAHAQASRRLSIVRHARVC